MLNMFYSISSSNTSVSFRDLKTTSTFYVYFQVLHHFHDRSGRKPKLFTMTNVKNNHESTKPIIFIDPCF